VNVGVHSWHSDGVNIILLDQQSMDVKSIYSVCCLLFRNMNNIFTYLTGLDCRPMTHCHHSNSCYFFGGETRSTLHAAAKPVRGKRSSLTSREETRIDESESAWMPLHHLIATSGNTQFELRCCCGKSQCRY